MLQAMNTGHEGSLTTVHANSPRDALARVETMIQFANTSLPLRAVREQISSALEIVIQIARMADGTRRVVSITEITAMEGEIISTQELFRFHRRGIAADGRVIGHFETTGVTPTFIERLHVAGIDLSPSMFLAI
jgi:pilus assembly protein CpaF